MLSWDVGAHAIVSRAYRRLGNFGDAFVRYQTEIAITEGTHRQKIIFVFEQIHKRNVFVIGDRGSGSAMRTSDVVDVAQIGDNIGRLSFQRSI